jgi:hypothetical protein
MKLLLLALPLFQRIQTNFMTDLSLIARRSISIGVHASAWEREKRVMGNQRGKVD